VTSIYELIIDNWIFFALVGIGVTVAYVIINNKYTEKIIDAESNSISTKTNNTQNTSYNEQKKKPTVDVANLVSDTNSLYTVAKTSPQLMEQIIHIKHEKKVRYSTAVPYFFFFYILLYKLIYNGKNKKSNY
jgi:hypothetical protein